MFPSQRGAASLLLLLSVVAPASARAERGPGADHVARVPAAAGSIRGRVTEKATGQPIVSAQVTIVGQRTGTITNNNGEYVLRGITPGQLTVRATRIGYQPQTATVSVPDGGEATANFQLDHAVARLEEVVTTATGNVARREFGNVVATVNADSIAQAAPITNVNEMLQGRTAGVQVIQGQGVVGASSSIRIRGTSSLSLTNEPLIVVDGVRYDNQPEPGNVTGVRVNRMNFTPDEIESIDVIKGPSAAALYGTAAANGVIIIKTKRGASGPAKWNAWFEQGAVSQPAQFPSNYYSWTHFTNSKGQVVNGQCKIYQAGAGQCTIDSLTSYNPYRSDSTNYWHTNPSTTVGVQVSGGSEQLKYFVSGERQDQYGPYKMPGYEISRITQKLGYAPSHNEIYPNELKQNSLRGNFSLGLSPSATLDVNTGYSERDLATPFDGTYFAGLANQMLSAPGYKTPTNGTQREFVGDVMQVQQRLTDQRFTGSSSLNWTVRDWLTARAVTGVDMTSGYNYMMQLPGEGTNTALAWGPTSAQGYSGKDSYRNTSNRYSVDLGATATRQLLANLTSKTAIGWQWNKDELYQLWGEGYGLALGSSNPGTAGQRLASETTSENATYGEFIEEELGYNDRLFLTTAVRTDQNSAFGRSVGNTVYPRASLSYVVSEEPWFPKLSGMDRLRLRASFGRAGVQPGTLAALQYLGAVTYPVGGVEVPGLRLASVGNENLKPEVTTETEGGADVSFFGSRVNVEATVFKKMSRDALYALPLPPSYGEGAFQWVNVARVQNRGVELAVDATLLRTAPLSWDIRLNGSHLKNKLVSAGTVNFGATQGVRNVAGYPLFGLWDRPYTYSDANKDGIIEASEVTRASADAYRGSTLPEYEAGFTNNFGFFKDKLRLSTLFDYRGKFWNSYTIGYNRCNSSGNCQAVNDPKAPLDQQAAAVAATLPGNTHWGFFAPNDFVRFRELSLEYAIPQHLTTKVFGTHATSLVLSGRNLGVVWTRYPGVDPEANRSVANTGGGNDDLGTPPAPRYWLGRINVAF